MKKSFVLLTILSVFLGPLAAYASSSQVDCADVRLDAPMGSIEAIPLFNQDHTQLCGPMQASSAVQSILNSQKQTTFVISPISMAVETVRAKISYMHSHGLDQSSIQRTWNSKSLDYSSALIFFLNGQGSATFCDNNYLSRFYQGSARYESIARNAKNLPYTAQNSKFQISEFIDFLFVKLSDSVAKRGQLSSAEGINSATVNARQILQTLAYQSGMETNLPSEASIVKALLETDPENSIDSFGRLLNAICNGNTMVASWSGLKFAMDNSRSKNWMAESRGALAQHLKKPTDSPIMIDFCGGLVHAGSGFQGLSVSEAKFQIKTNCGPHAGLISGRRWNATTKQCEILVRPNAGSSCYPDQNGNSFYKKWPCEAGALWIEEEALLENTFYLFQLNKKNPSAP